MSQPWPGYQLLFAYFLRLHNTIFQVENTRILKTRNAEHKNSLYR